MDKEKNSIMEILKQCAVGLMIYYIVAFIIGLIIGIGEAIACPQTDDEWKFHDKIKCFFKKVLYSIRNVFKKICLVFDRALYKVS